jgi:hypothetical protein
MLPSDVNRHQTGELVPYRQLTGLAGVVVLVALNMQTGTATKPVSWYPTANSLVWWLVWLLCSFTFKREPPPNR